MYTNLDSPFVQRVFEASGILDSLLVAGLWMSVAPLPNRERLYQFCQVRIEELRVMNHDFWDNLEETQERLQKLDAELARLVEIARPPEIASALAHLNIKEAVASQADCPVCGGWLRSIESHFSPDRYCCHTCSAGFSAARWVLRQSFGTDFI